MNNIFFAYYGLLIFIVSSVVMVGVSYLTAPPAYEKIQGLTFGTLTDDDRRSSRGSWDWKDVLSSVIIVLVIIVVYIYFRG